MNDFLRDDASHVLEQYRAEVITDPGIALDIHRLFAYELFTDGLATREECRESERALATALDLAAQKRRTRPVNTIFEPVSDGSWNVVNEEV
jgi:hypothetical protein